MTQRSEDEVRNMVREQYGKVAEIGASAGCAPSCCSAPNAASSLQLGYSSEELASLPDGADMGLGCGNPQAIAALKAGETALDLGSGGGFDCFLAAKQVGPTGRAIGVDMTAQMVDKARKNAQKAGATNVEFRLGEIERLPVADGEVDVILSNCVINLSPNKPRVFAEAYRVLRPGGRLAISDVVMLKPVPPELQAKAEALIGCVSGAATVEELRRALADAGFADVRVTPRPESRAFISQWLPGSGAEDYVASATIEATKPLAARSCCGPACCPPGAST